MNRRQIKKAARGFLRTGYLKHRYYETRCPDTDGRVWITEVLPVSGKLYREILHQSGRRSHWDSPFIISIEVRS